MAEDKTLKVRATGIRVAHPEHDKKGTIYDLKGSNLVKVIWDMTDTWMIHGWIVEVGDGSGWVMAVMLELGAAAKWNLDMMQGTVQMCKIEVKRLSLFPQNT